MFDHDKTHKYLFFGNLLNDIIKLTLDFLFNCIFTSFTFIALKMLHTNEDETSIIFPRTSFNPEIKHFMLFKSNCLLLQSNLKLLKAITTISLLHNLQLQYISTSIYMSPWFETSIVRKKMLLLMMMRAQRQSYLSIGGMMDMNVETYGSVRFISIYIYFLYVIYFAGPNILFSFVNCLNSDPETAIQCFYSVLKLSFSFRLNSKQVKNINSVTII